MRIAIISDCHFGFNEDALPQAREAMLKALKLNADAILLPGDIYDIRIPRQETVKETIELFSEISNLSASNKEREEIEVFELDGDEEKSLKNNGIPILAIWGTHERRGKGLANIIQILDSANLVLNFHTRTVLLKKSGKTVALQGLGGVPEEYFKRTLEVAEFKPVDGAYNIFVFHQNLKELLPVEREEDVAMEELPDGFELYVNGHIHWNHDLNIHGRRLLVAGSTVVTQMKKNEEKQKGFYMFDSDNQKAEFIPIESRPFYFRELVFSNATALDVEKTIDLEISKLLSGTHMKKPRIKLKLEGTLKNGENLHLQVEKVVAKYDEMALIYVDKNFETKELKDRIEGIRRLRQDGRNAREMGMEILKEKLKQKGILLEDPQELFEMLAEGEIEKAIDSI
ncbi:metallophosphoesterase [Candidatus Micrarchaeota archaeon]|nr:metallophosphoesterase [Candidatus Micrarchaeota archaeon]